MSKFDDLLVELTEAGTLDTEAAERIRQASDGSPLRKELEELRGAHQAAQAERDAMRAKLTAQTFDSVGIGVKPDALRLPEDLDTTDPDKVRAWATEAGLIQSAPSAPPEELAAHDRMAQAARGSTTPGNPATNVEDWLKTIDPDSLSEKDFWATAERLGRTQETARE